MHSYWYINTYIITIYSGKNKRGRGSHKTASEYSGSTALSASPELGAKRADLSSLRYNRSNSNKNLNIDSTIPEESEHGHSQNAREKIKKSKSHKPKKSTKKNRTKKKSSKKQRAKTPEPPHTPIDEEY